MHSYTNGTLLTPLQTVFTNNSLEQRNQTGHSRDPHIITRKMSSATRTFIYQCPKAWLATPNCIYHVLASFSVYLCNAILDSV